MMNLTEKEEQEMIERAKSGDPKANYDMSLWALEQAAAEPDEERWNRLAAKCLVKASEGGYEPATERMAQLLSALHSEQQAAQAADAPSEQSAAPAADDSFDWSQEPDARPASEHLPQEQPNVALRAVAVAGIAAKAIGSGAKVVYSKGRELISKLAAGQADADDLLDETEQADDTDTAAAPADTEAPATPTAPTAPTAPAAPTAPSAGAKHAASKKFSLPDFSQWDEKKWKKMQKICIGVCVVLALLIVIMITSGKKEDAQEDTSQLPPAATTVPATPVPTAEPVVYPDETVRAEIQAATLDIYPQEDEYVEEETTATVTPSAGLNLRRGPGSSYSQIVLMSTNSQLEVYAYKNGWALVRYQGTTWGWCSSDYIKVQ
jgi:hypothetical protein